MEETTIAINIELKTENLEYADKVMKKMLSSLDFEALDKIKNARVSKTIAEVEVSSAMFDEKEENNGR